MIYLVWLLVFVPLGVVGAIAFSVYSTIQKLDDARLVPMDPNQNPRCSGVATKYGTWAHKRGMNFEGCYAIDGPVPMMIVAWQSFQPVAYFVVYLVPEDKSYFEFVSVISEQLGATLTTTTSIDAFVLPSPDDCYKQCFSRATPEQLLKHHVAAQQYLNQTRRIGFVPPRQSLPQSILISIKSQLKFVRSKPLYPLRAVWWYFVTRNSSDNKSVQQQES